MRTLKVEFKEKDEWRDICGYEGFYQVSHLGKVRSLKDNHGNERIRILKQYKDKKGYMHVHLAFKGKDKNFQVHRLVAGMFIPNPLNLPQVNHIYEDEKDNNTKYNLEWCTSKYNNNYGAHNKKISEKLSKRVYQYTLDKELVKVWDSMTECKYAGFSQPNISACCNGKRNKYKDYIWRFTPITDKREGNR